MPVILGGNTGIYLASLTPPAPALLLDTYPNAAVAYSLRKLRTAYTGNAIRVRRSSDNTEQNIGFVNNVLDTASLNTFCSGTNGFVTTWYDQSGNGQNFTMDTASFQFKIYDSVTGIILNNGKAAMTTGSGKSMYTNYFLTPNYTNGISSFVLFKQISQIGGGYNIDYFSSIGNSNVNQSVQLYITGSAGNPTQYGAYLPSTALNTAYSSGTKLLSNYFKSGNSNLYINNSLASSSTNTFSSPTGTPYRIRLNGLEYLNSIEANIYLQEYIIYNNDVSSSNSGINGNINTYYSIY